MRTSSLTGLTGLEAGGGSINVQGEEQKKLDVIANDVLKNALRWNGRLATIASEEEDEPVDILGSPVYSNDILVESDGHYVAVFDPLDGSSNIDAGIPVGTIFGIFDQPECPIDFDNLQESEERCLQDALQPGTNLVAAGYCLYSSATTFVFTLGVGVFGFTLDERIGEFVLTHPNMKIPSRGKIYSFNEANRWDWDAPLQKVIHAHVLLLFCLAILSSISISDFCAANCLQIQYVTDVQQGLVRKTIPIDLHVK